MIDRCRYLLVSSISNAVFIFSVVIWIPYFCISMRPLYAAGAASGRYFWIDRAVKPGNVENYLLLIALSTVCFGGLNAAWWRYLMSAAFYVIPNAMCAMCLVLLISIFGDMALHYCNGNIHNLVCVSMPLFHTSLLL